MTARYIRPDTICCCRDCDLLGSHTVALKVWATNRDLGALHVHTPFVVCPTHHDAPPMTAPEFFNDDERARLETYLRAVGSVMPDYSSAEWLFEPIPQPSREHAH